MLSYLVRNGGVPGTARAKFEMSLKLYPVTGGRLGQLIDEGEKSTSHLRPYVRVSRGTTRQVSCANTPRLWNNNVPLRPDSVTPGKIDERFPVCADGTSSKRT